MFQGFGINCKGGGCENNIGIKCDNHMIINQSDLAEHFNNYFVNVESKLKESIINSDFERLNNFVLSKLPSDIEFKILLTNIGFVRFVIKLKFK